MDVKIKDINHRLRNCGICVGVMVGYAVSKALIPHEVERWPENLGLNDLIGFGLGLLICLSLWPVLMHGTNQQRMAAVAIGLFPTWVLYTEIQRFLYLVDYAK